MHMMLLRCKPGDDRLMFQRDESTVIKPCRHVKLQQPLAANALLDPQPLTSLLL
jgi:hypothetical protein